MNKIQHELVPKHEKLSEEEKEKVLSAYHVTTKEFPKILKDDPAIVGISVKVGDLIRVVRVSKTAGTSFYYRVVIDG